ncbi:MAG: DeoR/GlpR transcriptional regulator, partial [Actinomycetia bacterium]|nr:DeoR/GlpR transcriptional regulator [Actinomycetes bacterium]
PFDTARLRERSFEEAAVEAAEAKARIAAAAVDLLESGMSLLLDVGTTAAAVARELLRRDRLRELTVITNGLSIALLLEAAIPRLQVVVTGGTLRPPRPSASGTTVTPAPTLKDPGPRGPSACASGQRCRRHQVRVTMARRRR